MNAVVLNGLTPAQLSAVQLVTVILNCFNGQGLLDGVSRYSTLEGRVKLAAARARDLGAFYSILARDLRLPQPSAEQQNELLPPLVDGSDAPAVLRCLATETPYVVMLAREMHSGTKDERKAAREAKKATREAREPAPTRTPAPTPLLEAQS